MTTTLTKALAARGFAHWAPPRGDMPGTRTIYRIDTGETVGVMDAPTARAWLCETTTHWMPPTGSGRRTVCGLDVDGRVRVPPMSSAVTCELCRGNMEVVR